ncbi:MAG: pyridoxal-phosphate dependent enzyme [Deltaproteobacteria bacterium]|nr:pyridoxal-phosphate dependent enzyme [Candidatus Zymogenaceae bacterium]
MTPVSLNPLFQAFPTLEARLPHVTLGDFPTPVHRMKGLEDRLGVRDLYIKREDKSSSLYGGNKIRKLEFLLGKAVQDRATHTITFGYAGSNHTLATAVFARKLGISPISIHLPQHNARYVRNNLLYQERLRTAMYQFNGMNTTRMGFMKIVFTRLLSTGRLPSIIPPGGSSVLGVVGVVGSIFELKRQIEGGELPEPDLIYLPVGSCGTAAGVLLGVKAAGLKSRVVGIAVAAAEFSNKERIIQLFDDTARLLKKLEPNFPEVSLSENDFDLSHDFIGDGYARFTESGMSSVQTFSEAEDIRLEGTYTGKAGAGLIAHAESGLLEDKTTLFWNTHNSVDFSERISDVDYRNLPSRYHRYFEKEYQPFERTDG